MTRSHQIEIVDIAHLFTDTYNYAYKCLLFRFVEAIIPKFLLKLNKNNIMFTLTLEKFAKKTCIDIHNLLKYEYKDCIIG